MFPTQLLSEVPRPDLADIVTRRALSGIHGSQLIRWAPDGETPDVQDGRVEHRRLDSLVAEKLLDPADVVAVFEQTCDERVPQSVIAASVGDAGADRPWTAR